MRGIARGSGAERRAGAGRRASPPRCHRVPPGAPGSRAERREDPFPASLRRASRSRAAPASLSARTFSLVTGERRAERGVSSGLPRRGAAGSGELLALARCHAALEAARREKGGISAVASPVHCEASGPPRHPPGRPGPAQDVDKSPGRAHKVCTRRPCRRGGSPGAAKRGGGSARSGQAGRARGAPVPRGSQRRRDRGDAPAASPRGWAAKLRGDSEPGLAGAGSAPAPRPVPKARRGKGLRRRLVLFVERIRAGWGRRRPLSSPISLSCSKSTFSRWCRGRLERGVSRPRVSFSVSHRLPQVCGCRWWLEVVTHGSRAGILGSLKPQEGEAVPRLLSPLRCGAFCRPRPGTFEGTLCAF